MGGGNKLLGIVFVAVGGLSPRGRGKPSETPRLSAAPRSIPAWAGETRTPQSDDNNLTVYPRVGGGNRCARWIRDALNGLSPRGRGKPRKDWDMVSSVGSIPAWAGETLYHPGRPQQPQVYPRVGGGNLGKLPSGW